MDQPALDAEVKTRIGSKQKKQLETIARRRHLKVADVMREALREKIEQFDRNGEIKIPAQHNGVEVPAA